MTARVLVSLVGLLVAGAGVAGASQTRRVAGRAVRVTSVCGGGAAITRAQIEALPPPQPVGGKDFLVVAGGRISAARPAARFTTRADGTFATRLPPGTWCFFEAGRRPSDDRAAAPPAAPAAPNTDAGCLAEEKRRCDLVLAVKADVTGAEITFSARCSEPWNQPCYRGPMPP
jgi:hypothetical protein